jgi:hypothetical protein
MFIAVHLYSHSASFLIHTVKPSSQSFLLLHRWLTSLQGGAHKRCSTCSSMQTLGGPAGHLSVEQAPAALEPEETCRFTNISMSSPCLRMNVHQMPETSHAHLAIGLAGRPRGPRPAVFGPILASPVFSGAPKKAECPSEAPAAPGPQPGTPARLKLTCTT